MHYVCKTFWANVEEDEDGLSVWEIYTDDESNPSATYKGFEFYHWTPWCIYVKPSDAIDNRLVYAIDDSQCMLCEKDPRPVPALLFVDNSLRKWSIDRFGIQVQGTRLDIPCTTRPVIADYYEIGVAMDDMLYIFSQKHLFEKVRIKFSEPISSFVIHDTLIEVGMDRGALAFRRNQTSGHLEERDGVIYSVNVS